ncbi:MAG: hypothetical protein IID16_08530 [Candidatus Marinimicrobia bacterium]|nr:hypothetical protein [Candidatus Neomarinimicrobiota bacterium]
MNTGLTNGTTYYYRITAVDSVGNESGFSNEKSAVPNAGPTASVQTVTLDEDTEVTITLTGTDTDDDNLIFTIVTLPANGTLYQTADDATTGDEIFSANTLVTNAFGKVIYVPAANGHGDGYGNFTFKANDGYIDSDSATVTVNA